MIKYIYIFIGVLIFILSTSTLILWKNNNILREEKVRIQIELNDTKLRLDDALKANIKIQEYNTELINTTNKYRLKTQDLQGRLTKLSIVADKVSVKHPKLLSNTINNATKKVNECFEKISRGQECEESD